MTEALIRMADARTKDFEGAAVTLFRAIYQHMVAEEKGPYMTHRGIAPSLVQDLLSDHKHIYSEIGMQLRKAYDEQDWIRLASVARNLLDNLRTHHRKEERLFFPYLAKAGVH
jgi:hypothetical protein